MCRRSTLQRAKILLERISRRIRKACILVSLVLAYRFLFVGRCEIDGNIDRAGERISFLTIMDGARGETLLRIRHDSMLANCIEKSSRGKATAPLISPIPMPAALA